jgi:N-acetylglucosaminyldiphosphoundecaprenol N-acetyl-beta-D-mannosaminyltransferase
MVRRTWRRLFLYKKGIAESLQGEKLVADRSLLGVQVGAGSLPDLVSATRTAIANRRDPFIFACANPHSLVVARRDVEFRRALELASAVVADGVGCRLAGALSGVSVGPRITGSDFFVSVMTSLHQSGGSAYFFGSSDAVLAKLTHRVKADFPGVSIRALSPPFRVWSAEENLQMIEEIRGFNPDVLWVGMTAPKQEKWVAANTAQLQIPVIASIGAVFDYYAGVTHRAPQWICDLGLEWLYRLPREPRRLWRRTFVSAPVFLWHVLWERIRR